MNAVVLLENRFALRGGRPAAHHLSYERMWTRYLDVFDEVTVVGRLERCEDEHAATVEGPGVRFFPLPLYTGPREFVVRFRQLRRAVRQATTDPCAYILRLPGPIGAMGAAALRDRSHPYAVEVIGDPYDVFGRGGVRHPLRPLLRAWFPRQLRALCRDAVAAAYVTEAALQRRYPCPQHMTSYSSVELPANVFAQAPRSPRSDSSRAALVFVGDVNQLYKAPHVVIDAMARCVRDGCDLTLTLVGGGTFLPWLQQRVWAHGLDARVTFTGRLPSGAAVRDVLDRSDLFVLPSYTEGLPRAMLEAMSRGLPCIGSSVGGVGELLPPADLVRPGDVDALAAKLMDVLRDPRRLSDMSARNLQKAQRYNSAILRKRRTAFYGFVRDRTHELLAVSAARAGGRGSLERA